MIRREAQRVVVAGPVTLATVGDVLAATGQHLSEGASVVDLGEVTELDSSLLAAILCWMRDAKAAERELQLERLPEGLSALASLYGVEALMPGAPAAR